jgi:hypothetical protein
MMLRNVVRLLVPALAFALITGCGKEGNQSPAVPPASSSLDRIAHIHWLGKRLLNLDFNAFTVSRLWALPNTKPLQAQTTEKLAVNLWPMLLAKPPAHPIPAAVLGPMLEDLINEESFLELRLPTNSSSPETCFAIRLSPARAGIWTTNMSVAAGLVTGDRASSDGGLRGWTIQSTNGSYVLLSHVGDWILVATGPKYNSLLREAVDRISQSGAPFRDSATNSWFEADIDYPRSAHALSLPWKAPAGLSRIKLDVSGDGAHVLSDGVLTFSNPLPAQLDSWRIPTNLIRGQLLGFTSVRGVKASFDKWKPWDDWHIGAPPNQLFFWTIPGTPYQAYVAAPVTDAHHQIALITNLLLQKGNPWLANNRFMGFNTPPDFDGVVWGNLSSLHPFLKSAGSGSNGWLYGGLAFDPGTATNAPLSGQILKNLQQTNLVYYNWESTGQLLSPRLFLAQTIRRTLRKPDLPVGSTSLVWIGYLVPQLGPSETTIAKTSPTELTFHRQSTLGLTASELHLLADWLESPDFPRGLYTLSSAPNP